MCELMCIVQYISCMSDLMLLQGNETLATYRSGSPLMDGVRLMFGDDDNVQCKVQDRTEDGSKEQEITCEGSRKGWMGDDEGE